MLKLISIKYKQLEQYFFMIEQGLQQEINLVMTEARNRRLEFVTVEHLLLALLNMDEVLTFLRGKRINIDELRAELEQYIDSHTPIIYASWEIIGV